MKWKHRADEFRFERIAEYFHRVPMKDRLSIILHFQLPPFPNSHSDTRRVASLQMHADTNIDRSRDRATCTGGKTPNVERGGARRREVYIILEKGCGTSST